MSNALESVVADLAIGRVLARYCRGIDRRDPDLVASVFRADSEVTYGATPGKSGHELAANFVPAFEARGWGLTHHMVGNVLIEAISNRAARFRDVSPRRALGRDPQAPHDLVIAGRYQDRFQERGGEWKISKRVLVLDWFREFEGTSEWIAGPRGVTLTSRTSVIGEPGPGTWSELEAILSR